MKKLLGSFVAVVLLSTTAFANHHEEKLLPHLFELTNITVGSKGRVVADDQKFPTQTIVVAIPVKIQTGSVCVGIAGQELVKDRVSKIVVKGSMAALPVPCIQIFPAPVDKELTLPIRVASMQPAMSTSKFVIIGKNLYSVYVDFETNEVSINKAAFVR